MNKIPAKLYIITLFSLVSYYSLAQSYADDSQLWLYLNLEKKISKHFDAHVKLKGRLVNNLTIPGQGYSDVGFGFKINKNIKLVADYRYSEKRSKNGNYNPQHTYY